mgnify:FL=1
MKSGFKLKHLNPLFWIFSALLEAYWWLSKPFPSQCRYYPTCSTYARSALRERGFIEAIYLIVKRVLKCNPYSNGGFDYLKPKNHK